jgi:hypothetical protein
LVTLLVGLTLLAANGSRAETPSRLTLPEKDRGSHLDYRWDFPVCHASFVYRRLARQPHSGVAARNDRWPRAKGVFQIAADCGPGDDSGWPVPTSFVLFSISRGWNSLAASSKYELGNGWTDGVHPDDLQMCLQTIFGHSTLGSRFLMEYRLRRHDGEYRWICDAGRAARFKTVESSPVNWLVPRHNRIAAQSRGAD